MSSFLVAKKVLEVTGSSNPRMLVSRQSRSLSAYADSSIVTTLKRHFPFMVQVRFNVDGGSECESKTFKLGDQYLYLPSTAKNSNIFRGWYADPEFTQEIHKSSYVQLSTTTLYAKWEACQIDSDCTEFVVSCNQTYNKAGIYSGGIYDSTSAVYVDWGDNYIDQISSSISQLAHTYSSPGTYHVKVSNNLTSLALNANVSAWYEITTNNKYTIADFVKTGSKLTSMSQYAFYYCQNLSSIDFLSSSWTNLTSLPAYAFQYCTSLKSLQTLPKRIKTLGSYCFTYCTGLTGIQDLRDTGLTRLYNQHVFSQCTKVQEWKLPSCLTGTYFGNYTFNNNVSLTALDLPSSLTHIGSYVFINCQALKSVKIPSKVSYVDAYAFYGCTSLSGVQYETTSLTSIGNNAFYNNWSLRSLNLPDTVKTIGTQAFHGCYSTYLQSLALPSALTSLGNNAYQYCFRLKDIMIPSTLASLGANAFAGCYNVSSIVDYRLTAQSTSNQIFGSSPSIGASTYTGYKTRGSNVLSIYALAEDYCTGTWLDPLQNADKCGFNIQYIDPENVRYCTVTFDAGDGIVETMSMQAMQNAKFGTLPTPTCPEAMPYFGGWYTAQNGQGTRYNSSSRVPAQDTLTLYAYYSATTLQSYTIDLNSQWQQSTSQANPDSALYDGVYESFSNYCVGNGYAKMYVRIVGYETFSLYIRSYAESNYDYTIAMNIDTDVTSNPNYSTSGVKSHTRGNQKNGTDIANYTKVTYSGLDGGSHYICIVYRKDGSGDIGNDRGYVLVPKTQD